MADAIPVTLSPAPTFPQAAASKEYRQMSAAELNERITKRRRELGPEVVILAHHYQRKEVVPHGDFLGDSFYLSQMAARRRKDEPAVRYIVFCGVHFMAESADIVTNGELMVHLPNPYAGCPMADMAPQNEVLAAWDELGEVLDTGRVVPVSYINSAASLKAHCGRHGGIVCTSSNATKALQWSFARGDKVFFFPDQHLGRNTARKMGIGVNEMVVYDPEKPLGGLTPAELDAAKMILWKGHCHVHASFEPRHVHAFRAKYPAGKIVVHPECSAEVVDLADASGSTSFIVKYVAEQPAGAVIGIGTELNLISRVADEHPDKTILELTGQDCPLCVNMFRTSLADLAFTLDRIGEVNRVTVDPATRGAARTALERMLSLASA